MDCDCKGPKTASECECCSPSKRNRYYRGKAMTVADYQIEQNHLVARRRMLSRMVAGWGVLTGFSVEWDEERGNSVVRSGLAIDAKGRELVACEDTWFESGEDLLWIEPGKCAASSSGKPFEAGRYLLCAYYAERPVDHVRVSNGCGESVCEADHLCETVVFGLCRPASDAPPYVQECSDLSPPVDDPESDDCRLVAASDGKNPARVARGVAQAPLWQEQSAGPATGEHGGAAALPPVHVADLTRRGLPGLCICGDFDPCACDRLTEVCGLMVDLAACVPLAYVDLERGDCDMKLTNPVRVLGRCELTRIQDVGWRGWHRQPDPVIGRKPFFAMFETPPATAPQRAGEDVEPIDLPLVETHFWVCFTGPVQARSLTPDVIGLSLATSEDAEALWNRLDVRIVGLKVKATSPGDPPGTTRGFRIMVSRAFWNGEIAAGAKSTFDEPTLVRITIEGNKIIDWQGVPVDADSIADDLPSGDGWPGGQFTSAWLVKPGGPDEPAYPPARA